MKSYQNLILVFSSSTFVVSGLKPIFSYLLQYKNSFPHVNIQFSSSVSSDWFMLGPLIVILIYT